MRQTTIVLLALFSVFIFSCSENQTDNTPGSVTQSLSGNNTDGYKRAISEREFIFPRDFGPHPEFQTEWWYYTGNLSTNDGREFGYQLTFFRRAISPEEIQRESNWASNQIYFAHFALTDIENEEFYSSERWSRGAAGLAGAQTAPFRVWLDNWSIEGDGNNIDLNASDGALKLSVSLQPLKPIVLQGDKGLSQKSADIGNASYYFSQTRIQSSGSIFIDGEEIQVSGLSWLDREWSTSALGENQEGWDWFSIQLDDGREIMLYQLRLKNGEIDPFSSGSLISKDGSVTSLSAQDFSIDVLDTWTSPETKRVYPSKWQIAIPDQDIRLKVMPRINNQELLLSFVYWEGAVSVEGEGISGKGYVELTGY